MLIIQCLKISGILYLDSLIIVQTTFSSVDPDSKPKITRVFINKLLYYQGVIILAFACP
jgi:hypothetical protein